MEERLPVSAQHSYVGQREEFLVQVKLVLDTLIPVNVDPAFQHVGGRLQGGINGYLGDDFREDLALIIIFYGHGSSHKTEA